MSQSRIITISSVIIGTAVIASTLYAQSLQITSTIENATIMVRNIFLSPSGRDTGNASIKLEGDQGNVSIGGDLILRDDRYSCSDSDGTGCVLAVKQGGSTDLTEVALPQDTTVIEDDVTITGDSFFAKKGGSTDHLNRSANEIVFADPDIVPNAADAHLRVNVKDVVRATTTGTPKMVDVNGAINSRTSLEVSSPLDTTQKSNYNLTNTARTDFVLTKGDTTANEQSVRMKVGYHNGSQYTRQDMIISPIEVTQSPIVRDGIYCITKSSAADYGVYGSRIYKSGFNRDSVGIENDNSDTYEHMHISPQWQSSANPSIDGPSIRNGVRIDSDCDGTKDSLYAGQQITLGYSYYNTGSNRVIYVGMFGDNEFTLKVNDQTIIDTPLVPTSTNRWIEYRLYHIFPVEIKPGMNYFNIVGVGDGSVSDTIGMTIYNNTADQIKNATSDNSLNILFSTEQLVGQRISIATCPDGWILDTSGGYSDYVCRQTDTDTTVSHTGAKLGINTSGYPEHTLDVNGETLSQETLTVGYLNSGNVVTNIRQSVGIMIQNPSPSAQTAIRSQSCDRAPIPTTLQCSNGNCTTISLSGNEIASSTCYDWVGTTTTMQRAQMYQIMSLYSSVTLIADTNTQSVGINTLRPQSTLDVNGESYLDGSGYIVGTPNNIASITNGNTSIQVKELNNTESTPYTGGNTNCKGLSVDEAGHIILVQLPRTMCGATGSIINPPTPTVINGACGSSHNTTGTSAPTSNLCSTGTASSVVGSGPWTWSCAGSNGGTSASCQMNKQGVLTRIYNCDNKPDHTIWNTVSSYTQTSSNGGTTWTPINTFTTYNETGSTISCRFVCDEGYERDGVSCILDPLYCTEVLDPGGCFIEDTLVTLADGSTKKIQDIIVGDILKGISTTNTVISLIRPKLGNKNLYAINNTHEFVTANHPFLTTEGWKSLDPEATRTEIPDLSVGLLKIGDTLITTSGTIVIQSITSKTALPSTQLYNFELDGDHTYFANGLAVHNKYDVGQCPYVNDGEGNYIPSPSCTWYSYNAPVSGHPQRKLYPNLFGAGYRCTSSHSTNNGQNSCASYGMRCDRDARICGVDVISMTNICEAYCENNPNYTGPGGTPACSGLNVAMCNNNTPRCQWTDPTLL